MSRAPVEVGVARLDAERASEGELRHVERAAHVPVLDFPLPQIKHARRPIGLVPDHARRALVRRTVQLAQPDRQPVHQASRQRLQPARFPSRFPGRQGEGRLAVQLVEPGADHGGLFHSHPVVAHEVGNAARGIDLVVRAVRTAGLREDDFDPAFQAFLDHHDPRHPRVRRPGRDIQLHGLSARKRAAGPRTARSWSRPPRPGTAAVPGGAWLRRFRWLVRSPPPCFAIAP
jgi:hypothetical protein